MYRSFLNRRDELVLTNLEAVCKECKRNREKWEVDEKALNQMIALTQKARTAFEANLNPTTKNTATASAKNRAFNEMKKYASNFITSLVINYNIPEETLIGMGIRARTRTARLPGGPLVHRLVIKTQRFDNVLRLKGSQEISGHPKATAGPKKPCKGIIFRLTVEGEAEPRIVMTTKLHLDIPFPPEYKGKWAKVSGAWVNSRLQIGPWCDEILIILG